MGKKQIISGNKGKAGSLSLDHITKPHVPDMIQTKLINVGMKVYIPYTLSSSSPILRPLSLVFLELC